MGALALGLALLACARPTREPSADPAAQAPHCRTQRFEGSRFTVCPYDPAHHRLALHLTDRRGRVLGSLAALARALGPERRALLFATNAGMYHAGGAPVGLYISEGEQRRPVVLRAGPGNFGLLPNGVLAIDNAGAARVVESRAFSPEGVRYATQSGPMLVIDGQLHPRIQPDGPSRLIRNGVGADGTGRAWFAISEDPVSFGRFARFFRDVLHTPNALYLDGTVSSLWEPGTGRQDAYAPLGPVVAVFAKDPAA